MRHGFGGVLAATALALFLLLTMNVSSGVGATSKCMVINDRLNTTYPWKSLDGRPVQDAINAADSGDTLWVRGECPGPIEITKSLTLTGQKMAGFAPFPPGINALSTQAQASVVHVSGSGVTVQLNSLTLKNAGTMRHPVATGGGIWNEQATVTLNDVTITNNWALKGGGIYNDQGTVELTSSTIQGNYLGVTVSPYLYGGGIYTNGGSVTLNASTITNNHYAWLGGGIYAVDATVVANASEIANNPGPPTYGTERGGGIYAGSALPGSLQPGSTVTLTDTKIHGSSARLGGGIYGVPATVTLRGTSELTANRGSDYGGGAQVSNLFLSGDTAIHGNSAGDGGGGVHVIYLTMSGNATIYDNSVDTGPSNHGGGILAFYASSLTGCTAGDEGDEGVNVFNNTPDNIYTNYP